MSQFKTSGRKDFPLIIRPTCRAAGSDPRPLEAGTDESPRGSCMRASAASSEFDVTSAECFNAAIIGFNVRAHKAAAAAAKRNGIEIRYDNIIDDLVDDVKKAMSGLLAPTCARPCWACPDLGRFNISNVGKVAGCRVTDARGNAAPMSG